EYAADDQRHRQEHCRLEERQQEAGNENAARAGEEPRERAPVGEAHAPAPASRRPMALAPPAGLVPRSSLYDGTTRASSAMCASTLPFPGICEIVVGARPSSVSTGVAGTSRVSSSPVSCGTTSARSGRLLASCPG